MIRKSFHTSNDLIERLVIESIKYEGYLTVNKVLIRRYGLIGATILSEYISQYTNQKGYTKLDKFVFTYKEQTQSLNLARNLLKEWKKLFIRENILLVIREGCPAKDYFTINWIKLANEIMQSSANPLNSSVEKPSILESIELDSNFGYDMEKEKFNKEKNKEKNLTKKETKKEINNKEKTLPLMRTCVPAYVRSDNENSDNSPDNNSPENFPNTWEDIAKEWIEYKKDVFNFTYKSPNYFIKKLKRDSNNDINTAIKMVDEAIIHQWKGPVCQAAAERGRFRFKTNKESDLISSNQEGNGIDKINISLFNKFWNIYPNKSDEGNALHSWKQLCKNPDSPTYREIIKAVLKQKKTERWQDKQFIPSASNWLDKSKWLDDPKYMTKIKIKNNNIPSNAYRPDNDDFDFTIPTST